MRKKCMSRKKIEKDQKPEEGKWWTKKNVKVKTSKMSHFDKTFNKTRKSKRKFGKKEIGKESLLKTPTSNKRV